MCLTGQGCLFCASWDTGYVICTSHGCGYLFCASVDRRYLMCASHGSMCLFCPQQGGGIFVCLTGQGCLLCASWDTGYLICTSHACRCLLYASCDTRYLIWASHDSGCLFCAQKGRGVYCVPPGVQDYLMRFTQDIVFCCVWLRERAVGLYYVREKAGVSIVCPTGQGYLFCASQNRCVYYVFPGAQCL